MGFLAWNPRRPPSSRRDRETEWQLQRGSKRLGAPSVPSRMSISRPSRPSSLGGLLPPTSRSALGAHTLPPPMPAAAAAAPCHGPPPPCLRACAPRVPAASEMDGCGAAPPLSARTRAQAPFSPARVRQVVLAAISLLRELVVAYPTQCASHVTDMVDGLLKQFSDSREKVRPPDAAQPAAHRRPSGVQPPRRREADGGAPGAGAGRVHRAVP